MGKDGIYSVWIAMRRYPWLPPVDYHDKGLTGANLMKPLSQVIVIEDGVTSVGDLKRLLATYEFHGFPVIDNHREFVGYATRQELRTALGEKKELLLLTVVQTLITHLFFFSFFFKKKNFCRLINQILIDIRNALFHKIECDWRLMNVWIFLVLSNTP